MNETIEVILDEMLQWAEECIHNVGRDVLRRDALKFCDRIEAAYLRDTVKLERDIEHYRRIVGIYGSALKHLGVEPDTEKIYAVEGKVEIPVGNAAAMHEAAERVDLM